MSTLNRLGCRLSGTERFSDYIADVRKRWWGGKHEGQCAEGLGACVDTLLDVAGSDDRTWRCCPYWQRRLTNKLNGRAFAIKCGVPVPKLYWHGKNVNDIPFASLPSNYVIKTSFGSSSKQVIPLVSGRNLFNDQFCSEKWIQQFFVKPWLKSSHTATS
ncbi:MAG: hypothetical protein ACE5EH_12210 [Gammaproteobacteria bacterium]